MKFPNIFLKQLVCFSGTQCLARRLWLSPTRPLCQQCWVLTTSPRAPCQLLQRVPCPRKPMQASPQPSALKEPSELPLPHQDMFTITTIANTIQIESVGEGAMHMARICSPCTATMRIYGRVRRIQFSAALRRAVDLAAEIDKKGPDRPTDMQARFPIFSPACAQCTFHLLIMHFLSRKLHGGVNTVQHGCAGSHGGCCAGHHSYKRL